MEHGPTQSTESRAAPLDPESLSIHVRHSPRHWLGPTPSFKFKAPNLTLQTSAQWRGCFKTPSVFETALSSFPGEKPVVQGLILSKGCVSTNLLDLPSEVGGRRGGSGGSHAVLRRSWAAAPLFGTRRIPNTLYSLVLQLKLYTPQVPS